MCVYKTLSHQFSNVVLFHIYLNKRFRDCMMHISDHITDLNTYFRRISSDIIVKGQLDYKLCINRQIIINFYVQKP